MKFKLILIAISAVYLLITFLPKPFPPALNADEAAQGYNAYSLAETGRDEYGELLPLRLKSFGDYKLPLYAYLSVPVVKVFGLSEFSTRLVAKFTGFALVFTLYLLTLILFKNQVTALVAAAFAAFSPWIQIFANQAHETSLAALLVTWSLIMLLKFAESKDWRHLAWSGFFSVLSLYSYHSAKVVFPFLLIMQAYYLIKTKAKPTLPLAVLVPIGLAAVLIALFVFSEIRMPASRVKNLLLWSHPNITLVTNEAKIEARFSPYGQPLFVGLREFASRYLSYFSPEFMVVKGDLNPRFGLEGISPINYLEYLGFLVGIIYLINKKHPRRHLIGLMLLALPLAGALSWQQYGLSRTYALIILVLPLASYGLSQFLAKQKVIFCGAVVASLMLSLTSLFFLFNHYPRRGLSIRAWQSGYRELAQHIQINHNQFDKFYITAKNGQPYIFLLFYLKYPSATYQAQAQLSAPDEYGFGQVEKFDKYVFEFKTPNATESAAYIGFPDDFTDVDRQTFSPLTAIKIGPETIFEIYEGNLAK